MLLTLSVAIPGCVAPEGGQAQPGGGVSAPVVNELPPILICPCTVSAARKLICGKPRRIAARTMARLRQPGPRVRRRDDPVRIVIEARDAHVSIQPFADESWTMVLTPPTASAFIV